jgi:DNA repair exonuclease SbcCD nuclease subunit
MKLFAFSDLHIHKDATYDVSVSAEVCDFIVDKISEYKPDSILFGGDFFDKRNAIPADCFELGARFIYNVTKKLNKMIYLVVGNHDLLGSSIDSDYSLQALKNISPDKIQILVDPVFIFNKEGGIENTITRSAFRNKPPNTKAVALWHGDVMGYDYGSHVETKGLDLSRYDAIDLFLLGHYHLARRYGNIVYLGATQQMSFLDVNEDKFFYILDTETLDLAKHSILKQMSLPSYEVIGSALDAQSKQVEGSFIMLSKEICDSLSGSEIEKLTQDLWSRGARSVKVSPKATERKGLLNDTLQTSLAEGVTSWDKTIYTVQDSYVKEKLKDKSEEEISTYLKIGRKILKKAISQHSI